jgi:ATP-binding cassette, subfamily B, multidrug efflux pump
MRKLVKFLKPYGWPILLIFALLFGQAMSDLALPGLMANIVNTGVQQGGIENSAFKAIRAVEFDKITLFMTEQEKAQVTADYIKIDRQTLSDAQYNGYVGKYPQLADQPLYILNTSDKQQIKELDQTLTRYLPVVAFIESAGLSSLPNAPVLPPGTDPFTFISQLPADKIQSLKATVLASTEAVPPDTLKAYSAAYILTEYKAIGMNVSQIQISYMIRIGLLMLLLAFASAAASVAVGFLSAWIAARLGRDLRRRLFVRVEDFSNAEIDRFSTASLITRSTNDITQIQMLMVMMFRFVFYAPILATGGIIKLLSADRSMLWIIAAAVGVLLGLMAIVFSIAIPKFQSVQKLIDKLNLVTREIITGLMVVRAFNTQKHEEEKFDHANSQLTSTTLFINRVVVFMMPAMMLIMNGVMLMIIWIGGHQVNAGTTKVGDLIAFMQYAMQIIFSFLMISIVFVMLPRASVSAERVSEVLETEPTIKDPSEPAQFNGSLRGVVEFKNVSFRYPGAEDDVVKNVTLTARPGETTAFIGSTGSGKSTLVNLIPRFYDASQGEVLVDGMNVKDVRQHDLRDKIGYVSQKAVLFSGSIGSNIRYGNESASADDIAKYATIAQADDFIASSEKQFETQVSQGGTNLSGGQKQRLSIARALAKKPEIYIFDDSLSALDFQTDAALRRALKKETADATVLIVTQRVSTVMAAEQIVVLDNGSVADVGTHKHLMENCSVYREIALSQLSKEELAS